MNIRTHHMRHVRGHVEVYDDADRFVVSGDTESEAEANLIEILVANERAALSA